MVTVEKMAGELRELLPSLYDPTVKPSEQVSRALGLLSAGDAWQGTVLAEIESLRPGPGVPRTARIRRLFDVLHLRYVEQWTQRRVADELGITVRHLAREQARAIIFLSDRLLASRSAFVSAKPESAQPQGHQAALQESLASLEQGPGESIAPLGSALRRAAQLAQVVAKAHDVRIELSTVAAGIVVAVRNTVLVQILVHALNVLVTHAQAGEVRVNARVEGNRGLVEMMADAFLGEMPSEQDLSAELVRARAGAIAFTCVDRGARIDISLPLAPKRVVLVIDDNPDLIHYYQQCVANAPYEVVGVTEPERAVTQASVLSPDLIVLDLMMPDVDGYDILEQLQEQASLTNVPVIISSVISEQELALALGASLCLTKPVRRAAFLAGLDAAVRTKQRAKA